MHRSVEFRRLLEVTVMSGPPSLRAAGHALLYWQQRQEVNANNLANTDTPGFRAHRVFAEAIRGGLPSVGTAVDHRAGELRRTGGPLDLALVGDGRFVVETLNGERPVRSGSFSLDPDGQIVDADGNALLGMNGPLLLPPGPVEIDERGNVSVAGENVGRLRVVRGGEEVDRRGTVTGPDSGIQMANVALEDVPDPEIRVRQGYIEGSNVAELDSLVEMTNIQRSFQAVQSSVRAIDAMMGTVANRIGRLE